MRHEPGKRIVSKAEYAFIRRQESVRFSLMFCFGAVALVCAINGWYHFVCATDRWYHTYDTVNDPVDFAMTRADKTIELQDILIGIPAIIGTVACWCSLKGSPKMAADIDVKTLLTRPNTASLPAAESLLRASQELHQAQKQRLLRATTQNEQTPIEQLVRPTGSQEQ